MTRFGSGAAAALLATTMLVAGACGSDGGSGDDDGSKPDGSLTLPPDAGQILPPDASPDTMDFGSARPVMVGDPNGEGEVLDPAGDHDFFSFQATAGQWYRVFTIANAQDDPMRIDTVIRVYSAPMMAAQIAENDDGVPRTSTDSEVIFKAATTGTYYVEVLEYSDWDGDAATPAKGGPDFTFNLAVADVTAANGAIEPATDPGDNAGSAISVTLGQTASTTLLGTFRDMADVDVYKVTIPAQAGAVDFHATLGPSGTAGYGSSATNSRLWITDQAGTNVLARVDAARIDSLAEASPPLNPGTYLVWVDNAGAPGANPFYVVNSVFLIESNAEAESAGSGSNNTLASAEALTMENSSSGTGKVGRILAHLSGDTDVDYFSFPVTTATDKVTVFCEAARSGSGVKGLKVDVRKADDTNLVFGKTESNTEDLSIEQIAPGATGTFYLRLSKTSQDPEVAGDFVRCAVIVAPPAP